MRDRHSHNGCLPTCPQLNKNKQNMVRVWKTFVDSLYIYAYILSYTYICTHTHIHIYIYICIHTCLHIHVCRVILVFGKEMGKSMIQCLACYVKCFICVWHYLKHCTFNNIGLDDVSYFNDRVETIQMFICALLYLIPNQPNIYFLIQFNLSVLLFQNIVRLINDMFE